MTSADTDHRCDRSKPGVGPWLKYPLLFLVSVVICPTIILFHELRHYAVASAFHSNPRLHFARVTNNAAKLTSRQNLLISAAGPLGDAVIGAAGLACLYFLRRNRRNDRATWIDWCATIAAIEVARSLRAFTWSRDSAQPLDEAFISQALGMPRWLLPYLLAALCLIPLIMLIRLHAPRQRLVPFACLVSGGIVGLSVWMHVVGPRLLP